MVNINDRDHCCSLSGCFKVTRTGCSSIWVVCTYVTNDPQCTGRGLFTFLPVGFDQPKLFEMGTFRGYSAYYCQLTKTASERYKEKICVIGNINPYTLETNDFGDDIAKWPRVSYMDIVHYVIYH